MNSARLGCLPTGKGEFSSLNDSLSVGADRRVHPFCSGFRHAPDLTVTPGATPQLPLSGGVFFCSPVKGGHGGPHQQRDSPSQAQTQGTYLLLLRLCLSYLSRISRSYLCLLSCCSGSGMCPDPYSLSHLPRGCSQFAGPQVLGYSRPPIHHHAWPHPPRRSRRSRAERLITRSMHARSSHCMVFQKARRLKAFSTFAMRFLHSDSGSHSMTGVMGLSQLAGPQVVG